MRRTGFAMRNDWTPSQNSHSAGCDPHSRNDLPELPDITCLIPSPIERNLTGATLFLATAPAGATFSQRSLRKSLHRYIASKLNTSASFGYRNMVDSKGAGAAWNFDEAGWKNQSVGGTASGRFVESYRTA